MGLFYIFPKIICFILIQTSPIAANFHGHESSVEHVAGVARKDES
jgi:hypothetical protein